MGACPAAAAGASALRYDCTVPRCSYLGAAVIVLVVVSPAVAQLQVGAAAVEITPVLCDDAAPDSRRAQYDEARGCFRWVHLAGFSPYVPFRDDARLATGQHDPLWARTLAVRDADGDTLVIVATDLPGLGRKHTSHVRRRVTDTLGIPIAHVIIHSTHTHSAPDTSGYWSTLMPGHNTAYTDQVRERIYDSIVQAVSTLGPATMTTVTTTHRSCVDARTGRLKTEPSCRMPDINNQFADSSATYDQFLTQRDQRDPIVRNTRIVAAEFTAVDTGQTIATFINWHNHPDTLGSANRLISSDYPHYLREYMERERGGVAVYVVGTLGSQIGGLRGTPVPLWNARGERVYEQRPDGTKVQALVTEGWDKIRSAGYDVASAAVEALDRATATRPREIIVRTMEIDTPVDNMIHILGTWSVWHHDVAPQDRLRYSWPRCWGVLGCVRAEVSLIELGDLSILTAPGEIDPAYLLGRDASTADYGDWGTWHFPAMTGVDALMPRVHHAVIGSAQDYLSYMIPISDNVGWWNVDHPNHYEDGVTIGKRFGDDILRAWRELLGAPADAATFPRR